MLGLAQTFPFEFDDWQFYGNTLQRFKLLTGQLDSAQFINFSLGNFVIFHDGAEMFDVVRYKYHSLFATHCRNNRIGRIGQHILPEANDAMSRLFQEPADVVINVIIGEKPNALFRSLQAASSRTKARATSISD